MGKPLAEAEGEVDFAADITELYADNIAVNALAPTGPVFTPLSATVVANPPGGWEPMETMRAAFEERRSIIVDGLNAIPGIECLLPEGAFYAFPSVQALLGKTAEDGVVMTDDLAFSKYLLEVAKVAVVPGSAFGAPGFLRMSYAASNEQIREGVRRIAEAVAKLK